MHDQLQLTTTLDHTVLAVDRPGSVSVLLDLTAPTPATDGPRPAQAVQVVLDRSGSMEGAPLAAALAGVRELVQRLDARDWFGLVIFDTEVDVVVPTAPLLDRAAVLAALAGVTARGGTDLSAGYLRGLAEARRATAVTASARLLLVSDGHANAGVTDPAALGAVAASAAATNRVTTATIGVGLGYDELLLTAIARGGGGDHVFAETADEASAALPAQVAGLLSQAVQATTLGIAMGPSTRGVTVRNDLPWAAVPGGVQVELGGLHAGERRRVLLTLDVAPLAAVPTGGRAELATFTLSWVQLPALTGHTVSVPIAVNVVPAAVADAQAPDPVVLAELGYLEAQQSRRVAAEALRAGDRERAAAAYGAASRALSAVAACAPAPMGPALQAEVADLAREAELSATDDLARAAKRGTSGFARNSRRR